ncbi:hypothetical protein SAMN04488570_1446 [Nocardioides scoriae]|uniref:ARB-07466-like C-terminal domain-containing protein n=1 Tax=Nocardioides scoriae TaxID=642780 RepID=A0A1H1QLA1_9ACTN|nr:SH3 domain-containing protein [Nocardioides scoriae]SDS24214.1 hypothetical protein SAMN04488570_1446 [Nocardioides scoriae]
MPRGPRRLVPGSARTRTIALVTAPLLTAAVVGVGVAAGDPERATPAATASISDAAATPSAEASPTEERTLGTSRSAARVPLVSTRVPKATGKLWTTAPLKLRVQPREQTRSVGTAAEDTRVAVTGERRDGYAEVVVGRTARWVTASYLSRTKVVDPPPAAASGSGSAGSSSSASGTSSAPCPDGSSIESALQPGAVKIYRAVCAAFPELSAYGGQDGHGEHVNGEAIDFMVPSGDVGERVKDYLYANRAAFDLFDIIWAQHIWTIERSAEGFRPMEDRGSATANHFDHVHIKIN